MSSWIPQNYPKFLQRIPFERLRGGRLRSMCLNLISFDRCVGGHVVPSHVDGFVNVLWVITPLTTFHFNAFWKQAP